MLLPALLGIYDMSDRPTNKRADMRGHWEVGSYTFNK